MSELVITTHDFEKSKNELKVFSEQSPQELELRKVEISGGFLGLGDHKVTGYELNSLTSQVQDYLIDFNTLHTKFIKEFGQVYNALEALDRDYIQAILIAIKAAEKANNDVKAAQNDITKTIEIQKKTISALKLFKEKIEGFKHLVDIDYMWSTSQKLQKDVATVINNVSNSTEAIKENTQEIKLLQKFKEQIEKIKNLENVDELWDSAANLKMIIVMLDERIAKITEMLENQVQTLDSLNAFKNQMEGLEHIKDIDSLWNDVLKMHDEILSINSDMKNLKETVYGQQRTMQILCDFKDTIEKYEHLKDIDILWNRTNKVSEDVVGNTKRIDQAFILIGNNTQLIDSLMKFKGKVESYEHLNEVDEIWNSCNIFERSIASTNDVVNVHQSQIENLQNTIQEIYEKNEERSKSISKKLKIAYALAGSSIGIAIVEFVLLVARIL